MPVTPNVVVDILNPRALELKDQGYPWREAQKKAAQEYHASKKKRKSKKRK